MRMLIVLILLIALISTIVKAQFKNFKLGIQFNEGIAFDSRSFKDFYNNVYQRKGVVKFVP